MNINYFDKMREPFLKEKVALITGASKGIGRDIALLLAQLGAKVVINYSKNEDKAMEVLKEIQDKGGEAIIYKTDVSISKEVNRMVEDTIGKFGKIDILVNNAGITDPRFFLEIKEEDWDRMMGIHLKGAFNCCKYIVPHMIERRYGRIINMSSAVAKSGSIGAGAHYCAAKAGIIGFTKALANQLAQYNITVNAVAPAMIDTEMIRWRSEELLKEHIELIPMKRIGTCREVSEAVAYLASDFAEFITGYTIDINGGLYMD
ncbi:3-oxoacyl-ACP reductase family protein [Thermoanaerobacterium sp. DL9XJH110]|uniref:3-oxoacyl-ACP reductase family protein n=1 Tax=Thermoanaerobacterium sp. DL9XJH110 TaxID=3386643 RepID=UPI003BB7C079